MYKLIVPTIRHGMRILQALDDSIPVTEYGTRKRQYDHEIGTWEDCAIVIASPSMKLCRWINHGESRSAPLEELLKIPGTLELHTKTADEMEKEVRDRRQQAMTQNRDPIKSVARVIVNYEQEAELKVNAYPNRYYFLHNLQDLYFIGARVMVRDD